MIEQFYFECRIEARAQEIVARCTQEGGVEELRRIARLGLPMNRAIKDDSPELRLKVQEIADTLSRWQPLWLSGFRPGELAICFARRPNTWKPVLLETAPLAAMDCP